MKDLDVLGIGGPLLDELIQVSYEYLDSIPGEKGGMEPVDYETLQNIIRQSGASPAIVPGGSARNALHGLTSLGNSCALLGMVGKDSRGETFKKLLKEQGIHPLLIESSTPTAIVLSIITPDGDRTMRVFQGASKEIRGEHLDSTPFQRAKIVHLEGYTLYNEDFPEAAMKHAKAAGAKISFDLASFEIARNFKDKILYLLDRYVDVIFANEDEVASLLGVKDEEEACECLGKLCEVAVVLMGPRGCWVKKDQNKKLCPAYPVKTVDGTGAGDLFASGFLHGYLRGHSMEECAHYGALTGRAVVEMVGAIIPDKKWEDIFAAMKNPNFAREVSCKC